MKRFVLLPLLLLPGAALAQIEVSDAQRCVWACLANSTGASDPAYHQCVADHCAGMEEGETAADATERWQHGATGDGGRYAGIDAPGRAGEAGVYYFCYPGGRSYVSIVGLDGGGGQMRFVIDGAVYPLTFRPDASGWPSARIPPGSPVLVALGQGSRFSVQGSDGASVMELSLNGSNTALARTMSGC